MIDRFYDAWRLLEAAAEPDGAGAGMYTVTDGETFGAGLVKTGIRAAEAAEIRKGHVTGTLMHPRGMRLRCGQLIRREKDGAVFRVLSDSMDCTAPADSSIDAAQTVVERLVDVQ